MNLRSVGDKMQSIPRQWLYLALLVVVSVPFIFKPDIRIPNLPADSSKDLYATLMELPTDKPVLIESDWAFATRGENGGQFESLVRILMRRGIKFAFYTASDPQGPQVALNVVREVARQEKRPYREWEDYVKIGFYPNLEGTANAMIRDFRQAWGAPKAVNPRTGKQESIFNSPVLKDVRSHKDISLLVVVTASKSTNILLERLTGEMPIAAMVTGVMGPQAQIYHASKQLKGLSVGLKGVYDMETMMENGVTTINENGLPVAYPGFPGMKNYDKGGLYMPTLHMAMGLLIVSVVIGNIGMVLARRTRRSR